MRHSELIQKRILSTAKVKDKWTASHYDAIPARKLTDGTTFRNFKSSLMEIQTKRLILREFKRSDVEPLLAYQNDLRYLWLIWKRRSS